jgi:uncharacterized SAM-binding protein YcdF (DUF218 family)
VRSLRRTVTRATVVIAAFAAAVVIVNGIAGFVVFSDAADDDPSRVDAIVVLGGEHDGREDYGLALARRGVAPTLLLSNPYRAADYVMRRLCTGRSGPIEVICSRPDPTTTRGEAVMTRRLATQRNWKKILIVTWRYHLPRARLVFGQCLSSDGVSIAAEAVPRRYVLPVWYWEYIYFYQFAGIAKAVSVEHC